MSESKQNSWDRERIREAILNLEITVGPLETTERDEIVHQLVELLGSVRAEAIGWTWTEACSQHDRGMDPRNFEVPKLLEMANADLNPERSE